MKGYYGMKQRLAIIGACSTFIAIIACADGDEDASRTPPTGELPSITAGSSSFPEGSAGAGRSGGTSRDNPDVRGGVDTEEGSPEPVDAGSEPADGSTPTALPTDDAGTLDGPSGELEPPTQGDGEECNSVDNRILLAEGTRCTFSDEQRELLGQIVGTSPPEGAFCTNGSVNIGFAIGGQITINELLIRCTRVMAATGEDR